MSSFGGTVKLTGENEYRAALKEISGNLKTLNVEMKAVTSGYDKNDKSIENLAKQNGVLNEKISEQEKKVSVLKDALEKAKKETGDNSETTQKWQKELDIAEAELGGLNKQLNNNSEEMEKTAKANKKGYDSFEEMAEAEEKAKERAQAFADTVKAHLLTGVIQSGLEGLANGIKAIGAGFGKLISLGEETKETQTAMAKLEASFNSAGLEADYATDTMYSLYGVLGDTDRAVEASNLLAKMSTSEADLEANSRILTGVFAEFGDSIPTEGLAEGMQATAEMGNVQGVLADALEWQGVNLDDYNKKLEKMSSSEERAAYIQETLTELYGESADAYREANEALIESNEAQLRQEEALARLGQAALPVQTNMKDLSSFLLGSFAPGMETILGDVDGLTGAFSDLVKACVNGDGGGVTDAMNQIGESLDGLIENLGNIIPEVMAVAERLISALVEVIAANLPSLVESGLGMLSSLLGGISKNLGTVMSTVMSVVTTLLTTIIQNLPLIISMGIQMLTSLIQGIADCLPELIPVIIDAVLLIVETLLDNLDMLIDSGIELILALADGLIDALPDLIEKIPIIIDKLIMAITNNLPKIIEAGITLTVKIAEGLVKAIPQLVSKIPEVVTSYVNGFKNYMTKVASIGTDLVKGIWNGISNATSWILSKIKGFGQSVLNGLKSFFGIHSPSTLFKDEIGTNLALGVGEGFADTMSEVSNEMQNAIPTEFDASVTTNMSSNGQMSTYDMMVSAFKQALTEVKVVLDEREMGGFVTDTVERQVFA